MGFDDDLLHRAQSGDRDAAELLLASMYPAVYRMAAGLSGREDVGRGIVRLVMTQAARQLPRWRDADEAQRWFYHHTVLTWRRASHHRPDALSEVLNPITPSPRYSGERVGVMGPGPSAEPRPESVPDAAYVAFLRALRALPQQQLEAFILHHGEHLNVRYLAVAMDCSTRAAELHLSVANETLSSMTGPDFDAMTSRMGRAYEALSPEEEFYRPALRAIVRAPRWPRVLRQVLIWIIIAGVLLAVACIALRLWGKWGK